VIRLGALSETELKNRREAFEDAISATKAAVAEGIVRGGGLAFLCAMDATAKEEANCVGDERTGLFILKHALDAAHAADCGNLRC
jgi:chaperonin GroEL